FLHAPFFPNDHRRDGVRSLHVRNVEALDAPRLFREVERILQRFANRFRRRRQNPESLFERMFRVALHEIQESPLGSALRREDLHFVSARSVRVTSSSSRSSKSAET